MDEGGHPWHEMHGGRLGNNGEMRGREANGAVPSEDCASCSNPANSSIIGLRESKDENLLMLWLLA